MLMRAQDREKSEWYIVYVMYSFDVNIFPLFLQIVVDWLRDNHLNGQSIVFEDYFKIDYENNTIKSLDNEREVNLNDVDVDEKEEILKERIGKKYFAYKKAIEKFGMSSLKEVYEKIDFNFNTWAKYGLLKVIYSLTKGKLAFVFFTQHRGVVGRIKSNRRRSLVLPYLSFYVKKIEEKEMMKELEKGILEEVSDIVLL